MRTVLVCLLGFLVMALPIAVVTLMEHVRSAFPKPPRKRELADLAGADDYPDDPNNWWAS